MFTMKCPAALHGPLPPIAQIYESILYVYVYGLWRRAVNTRPPPVAVQTWKHYISEHIFGSLPWKTVNKFQTEKIWRDDMPLSEFNTTVTAVSSTPLQHWPWYHQYVWTCELLLYRFKKESEYSGTALPTDLSNSKIKCSSSSEGDPGVTLTALTLAACHCISIIEQL